MGPNNAMAQGAPASRSGGNAMRMYADVQPSPHYVEMPVAQLVAMSNSYGRTVPEYLRGREADDAPYPYIPRSRRPSVVPPHAFNFRDDIFRSPSAPGTETLDFDSMGSDEWNRQFLVPKIWGEEVPDADWYRQRGFEPPTWRSL